MSDVEQAVRTARGTDSRVSVEIMYPGGGWRREGRWNTLSEPDVSSEGSTTRTPDGHEVVLPGLPSAHEVTVSRPYVPERDAPLHARVMRHRHAARVRVTVQDLDNMSREPVGEPRVHTGMLRGAELSDYDADDEDPRTITLTAQMNSKVTA